MLNRWRREERLGEITRNNDRLREDEWERGTYVWIDRYRQRDREQRDSYTCVERGRQTDRQTDWQLDGQIDRESQTETKSERCENHGSKQDTLIYDRDKDTDTDIDWSSWIKGLVTRRYQEVRYQVLLLKLHLNRLSQRTTSSPR